MLLCNLDVNVQLPTFGSLTTTTKDFDPLYSTTQKRSSETNKNLAHILDANKHISVHMQFSSCCRNFRSKAGLTGYQSWRENGKVLLEMAEARKNAIDFDWSVKDLERTWISWLGSKLNVNQPKMLKFVITEIAVHKSLTQVERAFQVRPQRQSQIKRENMPENNWMKWFVISTTIARMSIAR